MKIAILCPGPSLALYPGAEHFNYVIAVNRAAIAHRCNLWCCSDTAAILENAPKVIGEPPLMIGTESEPALESAGFKWPTILTENSFPEPQGMLRETWAWTTASRALTYAATTFDWPDIHVYGADWKGTQDFDGIEAGQTRSESRWRNERMNWNNIIIPWCERRGAKVHRITRRIEFTMTAMDRPEIMKRTLATFWANLRGVDVETQQIMVRLGHDFPESVKWCWEQPQSEYFFHMEDDWELARRIDINDLADQLDADPSLSCVNLRAYPDAQDGLICLSPGLHRTAHAREMAGRMSADANPERQLREKSDQNPHGGCHEGFKGVVWPKDEVVIRDIGREWMLKSGYRKPDHNFTQWERVA